MRAARESRGWSLEFVGARMGRTARTIRRYEDDCPPPSLKALDVLAELYGVSASDLLSDDSSD